MRKYYLYIPTELKLHKLQSIKNAKPQWQENIFEFTMKLSNQYTLWQYQNDDYDL